MDRTEAYGGVRSRTETYGDRLDRTEGNFTTWTIVEIVVPSHKAQTAIRIGLSSIVFKIKAKKLRVLNAKRPNFLCKNAKNRNF